MQGLGICIVSTSHGVMSDRRCRTEQVGGEVVALVS
jgi:small subunit ribosomal protein S8